MHVCFLVSQGRFSLLDQHACYKQKGKAVRQDPMEITGAELPLGYAQVYLRDRDGANALTRKVATSAALHKLVGQLPVNLVFEVQLYCNGFCVGEAIYRKQNPHVEIEQERGACVNLLQDQLATPQQRPALPQAASELDGRSRQARGERLA
jgi:hypothetical protein